MKKIMLISLLYRRLIGKVILFIFLFNLPFIGFAQEEKPIYSLDYPQVINYLGNILLEAKFSNDCTPEPLIFDFNNNPVSLHEHILDEILFGQVFFTTDTTIKNEWLLDFPIKNTTIQIWKKDSEGIFIIFNKDIYNNDNGNHIIVDIYFNYPLKDNEYFRYNNGLCFLLYLENGKAIDYQYYSLCD